MLCITLDTCVWLGLIKVDLHNDNNVFEELCFWIENKHLAHVTPQNIIREWDRNKAKKTLSITRDVQQLHRTVINSFKATSDFLSAYDPVTVEELVVKRINRVDSILKLHSEIAPENQEIYNEAARRNLNCLAPNHSEDSFRDTVNIITLTSYLKTKEYTKSIFATLNYNDFSAEKQKKQDLHPELTEVFKNSNLDYVYCDEDPFAGKLINVYLRPILPSFQDYLKDKQQDLENKTLAERKTLGPVNIEIPEKDYLENIGYIDLILSKKERTAFEEEAIKLLTNRHESYRNYFLQNLGKNGLV